MPLIELVGAGGIVAIGALFYLVRQIPRYVGGGAVVVATVAVVTYAAVDKQSFANWVTMLLGLSSTAFGLLIVRVMLIRSVSLNLLGSLQEQRPDTFGEEISGRLGDMRSFGLVTGTEQRVQLTAFGNAIGLGIQAVYRLLRVTS